MSTLAAGGPSRHLKSRLHPAILVLSLAVLAVFWPVLHADFVEWDDGILIYENKNYQPVTGESLLQFWKEPFEKIYTPLTYTAWGGLTVLARVPDAESNPPSTLSPHFDPRIFHSFSLLLHILSTLLAWALLRRLFKDDWAACAGALLWAIHPLQVEPVAWAAELKGVLAGFCGLCSLNFYVRAHDCAHDSQSAPRPNWLLSLAAAFCYLLALLSKPSAVCLPFVAWCLDFFLLRRDARRATLSLLSWLLLALPFVFVARSAQPVPPEISPALGRPFIAGDALAFYVRKIVFPDTLEMIYMRTPTFVLRYWWGYATWLAPVALGLLALRWRKEFPAVLAGTGVFVAALLPNLGLAPFIYQRYSTVADRYGYLALLGPAIALAAWLARGDASTPARSTPTAPRCGRLWGLCALWLVLLGVRSALQVPVWRNSLALWTYNINANPRNWGLINNVGARHLEQGRPRQALPYLHEAARLRPSNPEVRSSLATALFKLGRREEAEENFLKVLQTTPDYPRALLGIANILRERGKDNEATTYYESALRGDIETEDAATARTNLGAILSKQNRQDEAIAQFRAALQDAPDDAVTHDGLALALARQGQMPEAQEHWQEALRLDPKFAAARVNYGTLLAMQGNDEEALAQWQEALHLDPRNAEVHHNLATLLFARGQQAQAMAHWRQALKLRPDYPAAREALKRALQKKPTAPR